MADISNEKRRRGRPKLDPNEITRAITLTLPVKFLHEIEFDMEAHDQTIISMKMKEIIQYWLDNCPDRVDDEIPRKMNMKGNYNIGR